MGTMSQTDAVGSPGHLSSSLVQQEVEREIVELVARKLDTPLEKRRISFGVEKMEIDGVTPDERTFVEAFARIGPLKPGQRRKVGTDALKLVALRDIYPEARFVLAFADQAAADSVKGWQAAVLKHFGIEVEVVDLPAKLRRKVLATQAHQKMGNVG